MADLKYGELRSPRKSFPTDEPLFLFRAQDMCSMAALQAYLDALLDAGLETTNLEFVDSVREQIKLFTDWQQQNTAKLKLPD